MNEPSLQVGDTVEILPAPDASMPIRTRPLPRGTVATIDLATDQTTVYVATRRLPLPVPLNRLRRVADEHAAGS